MTQPARRILVTFADIYRNIKAMQDTVEQLQRDIGTLQGKQFNLYDAKRDNRVGMRLLVTEYEKQVSAMDEYLTSKVPTEEV